MASDADNTPTAWPMTPQERAHEATLRGLLRQSPRHTAAALALSELLVATDRSAEAYALIAPFAARPEAEIHVLTAAAVALKTQDRTEEALPLYQRARLAAPRSAVAEHNLAGALGDLQRFAESEAAVREAFAKGLDAPETWLVHARAQQGLGDLDGAEESFRAAVRRRPDFADALGDLAQLIWMRTADVAAASEPLDAALRAGPASAGLRLKKAKLLEFAGDAAGAYQVLMSAPPAARAEWPLQIAAAQLASGLDPTAGLAHARAAYAQRPDMQMVMVTLCQALLAAGHAEEAEGAAQAVHDRWPLDQHAIALLATAWRLLGDARYRALYDYDHFVLTQTIDTPPGWSKLDDFLADLAGVLANLHIFRTHPLGQSLRGGSQTEQSLALSVDPVIHAFFQAIDGPIRRYIDHLGAGDDPLRVRIADDYKFGGVWSVRLAPRGFHANHLHQRGWLSSACYVKLPAAIERGHEGWLTFGEPGVATAPPLGAEHFVKPAPGLLALFPSYMWHGTAPFGGAEPRLTTAFDVLPA